MHLHMTHDLVAIPASDYLIPNLRQSRHIHPSAFVQTPTLKDYYKFTFFPRTVIHWNALPTKIILLPTLVQFSNAVYQVAQIFHLKFQYLFLSFTYINPLTPYCINSFHQLFITLIPLTHFSSLFTETHLKSSYEVKIYWKIDRFKLGQMFTSGRRCTEPLTKQCRLKVQSQLNVMAFHVLFEGFSL